jgi:hypothetical protein
MSTAPVNDAAQTPEEPRERLRRQWLSYAAAAFDLMFHPEHQEDLTTFDQREQRVCELTNDLKAWLLQQHIASDPLACPAEQQGVNCPHCGKPAKRVELPDKPLFRRRVISLCGEVVLKRQKWRCTTCRVAFFPSGSETATGR